MGVMVDRWSPHTHSRPISVDMLFVYMVTSWHFDVIVFRFSTNVIVKQSRHCNICLLTYLNVLFVVSFCCFFCFFVCFVLFSSVDDTLRWALFYIRIEEPKTERINEKANRYCLFRQYNRLDNLGMSFENFKNGREFSVLWNLINEIFKSVAETLFYPNYIKIF